MKEATEDHFRRKCEHGPASWPQLHSFSTGLRGSRILTSEHDFEHVPTYVALRAAQAQTSKLRRRWMLGRSLACSREPWMCIRLPPSLAPSITNMSSRWTKPLTHFRTSGAQVCQMILWSHFSLQLAASSFCSPSELRQLSKKPPQSSHSLREGLERVPRDLCLFASLT